MIYAINSFKEEAVCTIAMYIFICWAGSAEYLR